MRPEMADPNDLNLDDLKWRAAQLDESSYRQMWPVVVDASRAIKEIVPTAPRRAWPSELVAELFEEQGGICPLCGEPLGDAPVHVDHIIPMAYGGGHERSNLQVTHAQCNQAKQHGVDPRDLLRYLEHRYMQRP